MTPEEMTKEDGGPQELPGQTDRRLQSERNKKVLWRYLALVIAGICLYETKSKTRWLPVTDSPQICVVLSEWWGLKVQTVYPVWRKPTGETDEYSERWCIKYPDNTWRVFYNDNGGAPAYSYALTNYATYF